MQFYSGSGQVPPSPIGNSGLAQMPIPMSPVGNYYDPRSQYQFYNPWEAQRRQDELIKNQNLLIDEQISIQKAMVRNANSAFGISVNEKELDEAFAYQKPKVTNTVEAYTQYQENMKSAQLVQAISSPITYNVNAERAVTVFVNGEESMMKKREGLSLEDQLTALNELSYDLDEEAMKKDRRNLGNTYNQSQYRQLISNTTDPLRSMFAAADIDDMEITLPDNLPASYAEKRAAFMRKLMA